jgi:hypothetical protein
MYNDWLHDAGEKVKALKDKAVVALKVSYANQKRKIITYLSNVETLAQKYKQEYDDSTSHLVNMGLEKGSSFIAGTKIVLDLNKRHISYPALFAKKVYTGGVGAVWKIAKGGRYPLTILSRGAGGFAGGIAGSLAFDLGKEATFYFKAYRKAW